MKKRRQFSAKFKAQVVLEALSKVSTITELATKHELHPTWSPQYDGPGYCPLCYRGELQ